MTVTCITLDATTREEMFRAYLHHISNSISDRDFKVNCCLFKLNIYFFYFQTLSDRSEGLSGRDIKILLDESTSGPAEVHHRCDHLYQHYHHHHQGHHYHDHHHHHQEADLASHFCPAEPHPGVRPCLPGNGSYRQTVFHKLFTQKIGLFTFTPKSNLQLFP